MNKIIQNHFTEIKKILKDDDEIIKKTNLISKVIINKIKDKKKVFVCGNGGSFADASHFVGELTATYASASRRPLPFILLGSNLASVTAWSNDFNYEDYIKREFQALYSKGDILFILSTSGGNIKSKQSINLIKLAMFAKEKNITIVSLLGNDGGKLKKLSNYSLVVNSKKTGSIQEVHKIIFHSLCETFEKI